MAGAYAGGTILKLGIDAAREAVVLQKMRIPKEGAGKPVEEEPPAGQCDPAKGPTKDSPRCKDSTCTGVDGKCTVGTSKGCSCVRTGNILYQW
jgi:hypothetical protein